MTFTLNSFTKLFGIFVLCIAFSACGDSKKNPDDANGGGNAGGAGGGGAGGGASGTGLFSIASKDPTPDQLLGLYETTIEGENDKGEKGRALIRMKIESSKLSIAYQCSFKGKTEQIDVSVPTTIDSDKILFQGSSSKSKDVNGMHCKMDLKKGQSMTYKLTGLSLDATDNGGNTMPFTKISD